MSGVERATELDHREDIMRYRGLFITIVLTALAAFALALAPSNAQSPNLQIYWIDVEGGAATLVVSPSGESMLVDTGFPDGDRDAKRIYAAAQTVGLKKIDYLVVSHWHRDHEGGLAALAKMIPIGAFFDHGDAVDPVDQARLDDYKAVAAGKRTIVNPGDKIPLKGVDVLVVSSEEKLLTGPVNGGGPNPLCADAPQMARAGNENQRMLGLLLTYRKFTFLNLVDLDWQKEMELSCPVNKMGRVTVYQTSRHGSLDGAGAPAFLGAITPQVVVVNNGPRKGLGQVDDRIKPIVVAGRPTVPYEKNAYLRLAAIPGIEGIWQGHLSLLDKGPNHNTSPDMIANFEETADCQGHWINASVGADGKFTVTNGRNGFSKTYVAREEK
jgi:beta-lactamase superfamily II metal-dependent hydrolase